MPGPLPAWGAYSISLFAVLRTLLACCGVMVMSRDNRRSRTSKMVRTIAIALVFIVAVVLLLMWLAGTFRPKVEMAGPVGGVAEAVLRPVGDAQLAATRTIRVPRTESAVGTVRAVHESSVASKLLARVIAVNASAGQRVTKGEVLVRLDDADLTSRLRQAEAAAESARALRDQAKIEFDRVQKLFEQDSATKIELERVETALKSADAEQKGAIQAVSEALAILGYATIRSPIDGMIVDKKIELGDTATPGQVLLTLYDPTRMQLVASVRESLTRRLSVGQSIAVRIEALDKPCQGLVSEIVPEAESASRTFSVKVTGPCPPGVYSGMFGRLLIPLDDELILVVPRSAARRVGQLDMVDVADGAVLRRRVVQLGRDFDGEVEVLSGLREGERVVIRSSNDPT